MVAPTLEEAIVRLQSFWRDEGCLLWQPMNTEVGAGTMNPATFLRALGPTPWKVAYVEPSVRPDDSRYGHNPNRVQSHTQFQVLLKPDTGNPVEQYLRSLETLGVDVRGNDVRLVEDNWESPALGAWGLGWEIWLNGMEITQFTYFQQAGGLVLDPPSVEITYGLERILMSLQQKTHFKDIRYSDNTTYGELFGRAEFEMSTYYLDAADVDRTRNLFALHEAEAHDVLERGLVLPAYSQLLHMSHLFNVLDARGAVGVAERAAFFGRMRTLSRRCADLWVGEAPDPTSEDLTPDAPATRTSLREAWRPVAPTDTLLVELGVEEMPPHDLETALAHLEAGMPALLRDTRLAHGDIRVEASPRRLAVIVADVQTHQEDLELRVKGPTTSAAFAADGTPTRAAHGFAGRQGISVDALERDEESGREFVFARVKRVGRVADEVLGEALPKLFASIRFERSMRWNESGVAFSRPVRWLVAMLGSRLIDCSFGVSSGTETQALRGVSEHVPIRHASDYEAALRNAGVEISRAGRRRRIWEEASAEAADAGGAIMERYGDGLLAEVADLVESPNVLRGSFDERFLRLPPEVLATVMVKHQRYFPIHVGADLRPEFVFVANGPVDVARVRAGNEAVIRARYADAEFFYDQDLKRPFCEFRKELKKLTVHERLGSMLDKAERVEQITNSLITATGLAGDDASVARRAAHLCKNDLATSLVAELSSLAGILGRYELAP